MVRRPLDELREGIRQRPHRFGHAGNHVGRRRRIARRHTPIDAFCFGTESIAVSHDRPARVIVGEESQVPYFGLDLRPSEKGSLFPAESKEFREVGARKLQGCSVEKRFGRDHMVRRNGPSLLPSPAGIVGALLKKTIREFDPIEEVVHAIDAAPLDQGDPRTPVDAHEHPILKGPLDRIGNTVAEKKGRASGNPTPGLDEA